MSQSAVTNNENITSQTAGTATINVLSGGDNAGFTGMQNLVVQAIGRTDIDIRRDLF